MDKKKIDEITKYYENRLYLAAKGQNILNIGYNKYSLLIQDYLKEVPDKKNLVNTVEAIESLERCIGYNNSFGVSCAKTWLSKAYEDGFLDALFFIALLESGYYELDIDKESSLSHFNEYKGKGGMLPLPYDDFDKFIKKNLEKTEIGNKRRDEERVEEKRKEYNLHVTSGKAGMDPDIRAEYAKMWVKRMNENAILIRHLDVIKVHVDFSNDDDIYRLLDARRVSTIHTKKTQELSQKLGFHLVGYVDREGRDINNDLACAISGYDYLGSFMLLFKTDDNFKNLPLEEDELESLYNYLTNIEDVQEESREDELSEDDLLLCYVLMVDVNIAWPKIKNYKCSYKLCVPVVYMDGREKYNLPYLNEAIEYLGIDRINGVLELKLHLGSDKELKLSLDKPVSFDFSYQKNPDNEESYRVGSIRLELKHFIWVMSDFIGSINIKEELHSSDEPMVEEKTFINYRDDSKEYLSSSISGNTFYPFLIDSTHKMAIVYAYRKDYENEDLIVNTYFPINIDSKTIFHDKWTDDSGDVYDQIITITYEK